MEYFEITIFDVKSGLKTYDFDRKCTKVNHKDDHYIICKTDGDTALALFPHNIVMSIIRKED